MREARAEPCPGIDLDQQVGDANARQKRVEPGFERFRRVGKLYQALMNVTRWGFPKLASFDSMWMIRTMSGPMTSWRIGRMREGSIGC